MSYLITYYSLCDKTAYEPNFQNQYFSIPEYCTLNSFSRKYSLAHVSLVSPLSSNTKKKSSMNTLIGEMPWLTPDELLKTAQEPSTTCILVVHLSKHQ